MKLKYILVPLIVVVVLIVIMTVIGNMADVSPLERQTPANVTWNYKDKKPYGGYVVYTWLTKLWDDRTPSVITRPFASAYTHNASMKEGGNVYVILARQSFTDAADIRAMESFVSEGNTLILGIAAPDSLLRESLGVQVSGEVPDWDIDSNHIQNFVSPRLDAPRSFSYKGLYTDNYFTAVDSAVTSVLGTNHEGKANFVEIAKGNGHVLLLLDPVVLTNYPLLHAQNSKMLEYITTYAPRYEWNNQLYWDEFYKIQTAPRSGDFSEWQVLMRYPAMRWAFWLTILTALLYVAFESKRRQRIIPDIAPLTNTSVEFVTTLGKLYYEHHDNTNLGFKMVQHLLEYIRTRYGLNTHTLSDEFTEQLSRKAGYPLQQTKELVLYVLMVRTEPKLSDAQLHAFYLATYQFYQNS